MTDEEIKKYLECNCKFATCEQCEINYTIKQAILDLIEKQQEEIKFLKKYYKKYLKDGNMMTNKELDILEEILNEEIISYLDSGYEFTNEYIIILLNLLEKFGFKESIKKWKIKMKDMKD